MTWLEDNLVYKYIAGIDEVGRGPIFGPVIACSIIMPQNKYIDGINDSKKLSEKKRLLLNDQIWKEAIAIGIGVASSKEIDEINIKNASKMAMVRAYNNMILFKRPDLVIVDFENPKLDNFVLSVKKGDEISYNVACASIVAKVYRDNLCSIWDYYYPNYDIKKNKGYGTKSHISNLFKYGESDLHRKTFLRKIYERTK